MTNVSPGSSSSSVIRVGGGPDPSPSVSDRVLTGSTVTSLSSSRERWVVRSKPRIEVTSSPHHSTRAGTAMPNP
jgi:hypothetical protein